MRRRRGRGTCAAPRARTWWRSTAAVRELLAELDGTPSALGAMQAAARDADRQPVGGAVLVAETEGELVGVLGGELADGDPRAGQLRADPGPVGAPGLARAARSGASLLQQLFELARSRRLQRVEVGLPRESFARFAATEAFYLGNGFAPNGPRMRRLLA